MKRRDNNLEMTYKPRIALNGEQGVALLMVIMIMVILLAAVGAGAIFSSLNQKTATNLKTGNMALQVADAGIQHGVAIIPELGDFDTLLAGSVSGFPLVSGKATLTGSLSGYSYSVVAENDTATGETSTNDINGIVTLTSTATGANNTTRKVRSYIGITVDPHDWTMITNGTLDIALSGNIELMGTCGGVHSNGSMTISGNPAVQMTDGLTSSGSMVISGTPCIGSATCGTDSPDPAYVYDTVGEKTDYANSHDNQDARPVAAINLADFAPLVAGLGSAGYIMHNDGTITQGGSCTNGLCAGGTSVSSLSGWSWNGTQWNVSGSSAADGVFYAESPVVVSGSPGSVSTPWQATVIARDSISWSGNPVVKPYPTTEPQLQNIMVATGNDLTIGGNMGMSGQPGAILVHQQINFSGNPTIYGYTLVGNGEPTWAGDPFSTSTSGYNLSSVSSVSGNPTFYYDCGTPTCRHPSCGMAKASVLAWQEIM